MLLIDAAARSAGVPCTGGSTETEEAGASAPNIVDTIARSGGSAGGLRSSQCMVSLGKIARLCGVPGTQLVAAFGESGGLLLIDAATLSVVAPCTGGSTEEE